MGGSRGTLATPPAACGLLVLFPFNWVMRKAELLPVQVYLELEVYIRNFGWCFSPQLTC